MVATGPPGSESHVTLLVTMLRRAVVCHCPSVRCPHKGACGPESHFLASEAQQVLEAVGPQVGHLMLWEMFAAACEWAPQTGVASPAIMVTVVTAQVLYFRKDVSIESRMFVSVL